VCLPMRFFSSSLILFALSCAPVVFSSSAQAQDQSMDELMEELRNFDAPGLDTEVIIDEPKADIAPPPDYSSLTETEERTAKLDALFVRLAKEENAETADLIAEEIMVIWIDSGSATVNLLLRRATSAEERGAVSLSRRLYDHVTTLSPDYAEGWARSARLAVSERDYNRAVSEITETLVREPRHFYALLTLGAVLEKLGRNEQAYEAYKEVEKLYPELTGIKDRVKSLGDKLDGDLL